MITFVYSYLPKQSVYTENEPRIITDILNYRFHLFFIKNSENDDYTKPDQTHTTIEALLSFETPEFPMELQKKPLENTRLKIL